MPQPGEAGSVWAVGTWAANTWGLDTWASAQAPGVPPTPLAKNVVSTTAPGRVVETV